MVRARGCRVSGYKYLVVDNVPRVWDCFVERMGEGVVACAGGSDGVADDLIRAQRQLLVE